MGDMGPILGRWTKIAGACGSSVQGPSSVHVARSFQSGCGRIGSVAGESCDGQEAGIGEGRRSLGEHRWQVVPRIGVVGWGRGESPESGGRVAEESDSRRKSTKDHCFVRGAGVRLPASPRPPLAVRTSYPSDGETQSGNEFGEKMVKLVVRDRETIQEAVRRFRKLVERSGIKKEMRRREYYEKPSETNRRARLRAERRARRTRMLSR